MQVTAAETIELPHDQPQETQSAGTEGESKKPWQDRFAGHFKVDDGLTIRWADNLNRGGLGIKLEFADENERPSQEMTRILREAEPHPDGQRNMRFYYDPKYKTSRESIMTREEREAGVGPESDEIKQRAGKMRDDQMSRVERLVQQRQKEQAEKGKDTGPAPF